MIKDIVKKIASKSGFGLVSSKTLDNLKRSERDVLDILALVNQPDFLGGMSKSQLRQDLMILLTTNFKRDGFFVEFGATNGIKLSNTYLLEKSFGWTGILAEPAKVWHEALQKNRDASIELSCVWTESNKTISFNMTDDAELSTISNFNDKDQHYNSRKSGVVCYVNTISLNDLLDKHKAPRNIDFLSIDTEGSELSILESFDFSKYEIKTIFCEHNFTTDREKIHSLLSSKGYTRKFTSFSMWDDWYFKLD